MRIPFRHPFARTLLAMVLLLAGSIALYLLAARFPLDADLTQNTGNSLDPASVQALRQLPGPLHVTVFAPARDAQQGDMRSLISRFVGLYQRYKRDITLDFVDPKLHPDQARAAGIRANGEMVLEYEGRRAHLSMLNEQTFTNALLGLALRNQKLVMYVTGHGEPKLDGNANFDLGVFGNTLGARGFRVAPLNLALAQAVPDNASLLVITAPQADWLPGETAKVVHYVDRGGSLLWLIDPGSLHGLEPLAEKLGLVLPPGIVIDPDAAEMNAPETWTLGADYPPHPVTSDFNYSTAFPFARALDHVDSGPWRYNVLVDGAPRGWVSENIPKGKAKPRFDKQRDTPGPAVIALALTRALDDTSQRVVVVGNNAFLSNQYAGNGYNLDLGMNMANWLAGRDSAIIIPPRAARDTTVTLSRTQLAVLGIGLVIALPLLLMLAGGWLWWRRR